MCNPTETRSDCAYFDNAAISPLRDVAQHAMMDCARSMGNPSSVHSNGRRARRQLEESRERIAECLGARPSEVIFVGSGTEADNLALQGMVRARQQSRMVMSAIEHASVRDTMLWLAEHEKRELCVLPVDHKGRVDLANCRDVLAAGDVAVMTVMSANNEVGTVQPWEQLAELAASHDVPLHVDAVQSAGHIAVSFAHPGVTTMSVASQKFGGPTGVGVLLARRDAPMEPLLFGGKQERGLRPGTQNLMGIMGMAAALEEACACTAQELRTLTELRGRLIEGILRVVPDAVINGPRNATAGADSPVLPGLVNVSFPGCEGDALLMLLDGQGISVSVGSACTAGVAQVSEVLLAMGMDEALARGTLRLSMGYTTSADDVDRLVAALPEAVERARRAGLA